MADPLPAIQQLIEQWRVAARTQSGLGRMSNDPVYAAEQDCYARLYRICADELEALLPALREGHREEQIQETQSRVAPLDAGAAPQGSTASSPEPSPSLPSGRNDERIEREQRDRLQTLHEAREWLSTQAGQAPLSALVRALIRLADPQQWRCFHCGEVFTTVGSASDHFGETPDREAGCLIDAVAVEEGGKPERGRGLLMALRKAEAELAALRPASVSSGAVPPDERKENTMEKPLTGLWRLNPETPEGKYLVMRRDGTVVDWPNFVLGAKDPAAPAALRAYADAGETAGFNTEFVGGVRWLADEFERYRLSHGAGDPDRGRHREDDPRTVELMRKGGSA